jgi:hypothetical protein
VGYLLEELNLFNSIEFLEPKCPNCGSVLDYGVNTNFDEKKGVHICIKCGCILE